MARTQTLVTATEWNVSRSTACRLFSSPGAHPEEAYRTVKLKVYQIDDEPNEHGGIGNVHRHPDHDGREFIGATRDEADDACDAYCLDHGLLKVYAPTF